MASITASSEAAPKPFNFRGSLPILLLLDSRQERLCKSLAGLDDEPDALGSLSSRQTTEGLDGSEIILCLELGKRLVHSVPRAGVNACPSMKNPINGSFAAATQLRDFLN